jgi:CBS domain-containing protein
MKISDIIRKDYLSFEASEKLPFAAKKLLSAGVSEAPVVQRRKYIGMFSSSDLARVLVKESMFGKASEADFTRTKNEPLFKHMHHFSATLKPDSDVISAYLILLHKNVDIIPVVGKNSVLVGVVRTSDLQKKMSEMLSAGGKPPSRKAEAAEADDRIPEAQAGNTSLDLILKYVQKKGATTAEEVSSKFGLPLNEIEEYVLCLEKHDLLKVEYDFFGKMKLKKVE